MEKCLLGAKCEISEKCPLEKALLGWCYVDLDPNTQITRRKASFPRCFPDHFPKQSTNMEQILLFPID